MTRLETTTRLRSIKAELTLLLTETGCEAHVADRLDTICQYLDLTESGCPDSWVRQIAVRIGVASL